MSWASSSMPVYSNRTSAVGYISTWSIGASMNSGACSVLVCVMVFYASFPFKAYCSSLLISIPLVPVYFLSSSVSVGSVCIIILILACSQLVSSLNSSRSAFSSDCSVKSPFIFVINRFQ